MCVPSTVPTAWGNPKQSNPSIASLHDLPYGIFTYLGSRTSVIALQVSSTIVHTVERPNPNS